MKVRHYGRMALLSMGCMLLLAPGIARAEHTKLFCLSKSGTLKSAVSGVCPSGSTKLPLAVADSVSVVQASAEISADGNVRQQDKVNGSNWIDSASLNAPGSYLIFFRNGVFQNHARIDRKKALSSVTDARLADRVTEVSCNLFPPVAS